MASAFATGNNMVIAEVRRSLFWGTIGLAVIGALLTWLFRNQLAERFLLDSNRAGDTVWIAAGVALSVAAGSQTALLTGLRRIGDLARIGIASSLLSTVLGGVLLLTFGERGILPFVLVTPLSGFLLGHWFVRQIPKIDWPATPAVAIWKQFRVMAGLGLPIMVSGLFVTLGEFVVRTLIKQNLGYEALGNFQAAWTISMTYAGLVLGSMGADYYPRLAAAMNNHRDVNKLVNEQVEVSLLLAGPVLISILALAPWIISILYSTAFVDAIPILRWQVLGDILKIASWPLGYLILAAGDSKRYLLSETITVAIFVVATWLAIPWLGVQATGASFLLMYAVYLPIVYYLGRHRTAFRWERRNLLHLAALCMVAAITFAIATQSSWASASFGLTASIAFATHSFIRIQSIASWSQILKRR